MISVSHGAGANHVNRWAGRFSDSDTGSETDTGSDTGTGSRLEPTMGLTGLEPLALSESSCRGVGIVAAGAP